MPNDRQRATRFQQTEGFPDECAVVAKVVDRVHAVDQIKSPAAIRKLSPRAASQIQSRRLLFRLSDHPHRIIQTKQAIGRLMKQVEPVACAATHFQYVFCFEAQRK